MISGLLTLPSVGTSTPASILTKVVFPMPFTPKMPTTSPIPMPPASTSSLKPPKSFTSLVQESSV